MTVSPQISAKTTTGRPLLTALCLMIVSAPIYSCNSVGDFAAGKKKNEIDSDSEVRKPAPKPNDSERAEDPIMTSGTYLTCEEVSAPTDINLELGCDLRSRSSQNAIALEAYFKSWEWAKASPTAEFHKVQIDQSTGVGKNHITYTFSGAPRNTLVAIAKVTRIIFNGVSKLGQQGSNEVTTDSYIGELITISNSGVIAPNPIPPKPTAPKPPIATPTATQTPIPVPTQTPVSQVLNPIVPAISTPTPSVVATSIPASGPSISSMPNTTQDPILAPSATPVADGPFNVKGYVMGSNGRPVVMVSFSNTAGISDLSVSAGNSLVNGNGSASINFGVAVSLQFLRNGKICKYTGPIGSEMQTLLTTCGE